MTSDYLLREQLIELARNIQDAHDRGQRDKESLAEFKQLLPGSGPEDLCNSDYDVDTVVEICLGEKDAKRSVTREELVELVSRFKPPGTNPFGSEAEVALAVMTFEHNCRHPAGFDLVAFPKEHFDGKLAPTPEEIVDKAMRGE
jgi:hypothetical protein